MSDSGKKIKKKEEMMRMVIMDDITFEEKLSWRFSMNKLWIWSGGGLLVLFILFFLFLAFTPLKRLMPGYASIENNLYVIKMNNYVNDLEKQLNQQEKYNATLRKLLVGDGDSLNLADFTDIPEPRSVQEDKKDYKGIYELENKIRQNHSKGLDSYYYIPPLSGKINNKIDFKNGHYGVDIAGVKNAPIKSIMEGIVVLADYTTEAGYTIAIQHPNDMLSIYKHNDKLLKNIGHFVADGEAIAIIGNTGELTDGPHLHFELWYKSTPLNPEDYILFE